jgi:formylmethanofuran dehydrogenase subunit C
VTELVLTLRTRPEQRLDLSVLVPNRLAGMSGEEIGRIALQTTRRAVTVADAFRLRMGSHGRIRIENGCDRLDGVGAGMTSGEIHVEGDVGQQAGRAMTGGRLTIGGSAGPLAASGMRGGVLEINGAAGDRLGGPLPGEIAGMRGGVVVVRGAAGERAGDRMRRGTIIVEGSAGAYAGSRMIAGTLVIRQKAGGAPGYLMKRGTIVLGAGCETLSPTFVDCGVHDLVSSRLLRAFVNTHSRQAAAVLKAPLRRFAGDTGVLGLGEILLWNGS